MSGCLNLLRPQAIDVGTVPTHAVCSSRCYDKSSAYLFSVSRLDSSCLCVPTSATAGSTTSNSCSPCLDGQLCGDGASIFYLIQSQPGIVPTSSPSSTPSPQPSTSSSPSSSSTPPTASISSPSTSPSTVPTAVTQTSTPAAVTITSVVSEPARTTEQPLNVPTLLTGGMITFATAGNGGGFVNTGAPPVAHRPTSGAVGKWTGNGKRVKALMGWAGLVLVWCTLVA
ncbi:hypothetical protein HK101_006262 [Irineochytrium annulatum]|nr:hypothetical protein HK101_006262 [Irineochytrium annulatum]